MLFFAGKQVLAGRDFKMADTDGDGAVSQAEWMQRMTSKAAVGEDGYCLPTAEGKKSTKKRAASRGEYGLVSLEGDSDALAIGEV